MKRFKKLIICCLMLAIAITLACIVVPVLLETVHLRFGLCPMHFARFNQAQFIPVIYGLPTGETWGKALRGEVALGGCIPRRVAALCPYCRCPARYRPTNDPPAIILDHITLQGLSAADSNAIKRYAYGIVRRVPCDGEEWVTAILTTPDDVWLGTFESGLHRFDRKTAKWTSFEGTTIGYCIRSIRQKNSGICVEHDVTGSGLFVEDYTEDHGKTWTRP